MKINIVITAGGTSEKIDTVRKITNSSSGKLGMVIANHFINVYNNEINKIYYICSKNALKPENDKIQILEADETDSVKNQIKSILTENKIDIFIHSMAISDYKVDYVTTAEKLAQEIDEKNSSTLNTILNNENIILEDKISSYEQNLIIKLKPTPKVISLIKSISPNTKLVGFKLLNNVTKEVLINTAIKLKDKNNCDYVIANDLNDIRNGNHKAYIIKNDNTFYEVNGKDNIALFLGKELFLK